VRRAGRTGGGHRLYPDADVRRQLDRVDDLRLRLRQRARGQLAALLFAADDVAAPDTAELLETKVDGQRPEEATLGVVGPVTLRSWPTLRFVSPSHPRRRR
jgi:hypothetical protein